MSSAKRRTVVSKRKRTSVGGITSSSSKSTPGHLKWLIDTKTSLKTADKRTVRVLELRHTKDDAILSAWATHFRNQYCDDGQLGAFCRGMNLSRAEYLQRIKFPDPTKPPGPSIRAGDFGEILVADYMEFMLDYWLPRIRYDHKAVRNESTKGSDIIGFKIVAPGRDNPNDALALFEAKAKFTGNLAQGRLQAAVDGSAKDELRKAESLNAIKQRYLDLGQSAEVQVVERFQNPEDRPHREEYGAVALFSTPLFDKEEVASTDTSSHPHSANLTLIVIHGPDLMNLVHELYRRAADEA
jgi:hypothetical protein